MARILSVNHRQIWTRSRSQTLIRPDQVLFSQSKTSQPPQKKCKFDDDENTECLGFTAAEICSRSPPLQPLIDKKNQTKRSEMEETSSKLVSAIMDRPKTKKPQTGAKFEKKVKVKIFCRVEGISVVFISGPTTACQNRSKTSEREPGTRSSSRSTETQGYHTKATCKATKGHQISHRASGQRRMSTEFAEKEVATKPTSYNPAYAAQIAGGAECLQS
jgi:hypothetical protein